MKNNYEHYSIERLKSLKKKRQIRRDELVKLGELLNKYEIESSIITKNMIIERIAIEEMEIRRLHNYITESKDVSSKSYYKEMAATRYKYKLKW